MSVLFARRFGAALLCGLCLTCVARAEFGLGGPPWVVGQNGGCNTCGGCGTCGEPVYKVCKKCNYKPPSVHPNVPYGYYPTTWARWPAHAMPMPQPPIEMAPPIVEPIPAPLPVKEPLLVVPPRAEPLPVGPPAIPAVPMIVPPAEPLPAPRPSDRTQVIEGPSLPKLLPAGFGDK